MATTSSSSTPGGKKKFVRQSAKEFDSSDMGPLGAYSILKTEATSIQRTGIKGLLADEATNLTPLLNPYLSGTAAKVHSDEVGADHESHNKNAFTALPAEFKDALDMTGTVPLQFDKEAALNVYCKIIDNLKTGVDAEDGVPEFYIDSAGGQNPKKKSGGFQKVYDWINVPPALVKKTEQDRCIFAMKPGDFGKVGGSYAKALMNDATTKVKELHPRDCNISMKVVHLLFHWNAHSFFTYHTDEDGKITVIIINLAHCKAGMHVAGSQHAEYDGIGPARLFPSNVFHRSGSAPRRCVKVAFFFDVEAAIEVGDDKEATVETAKPEAKVEAEVKRDTSTEGGSSSTPTKPAADGLPAATDETDETTGGAEHKTSVQGTDKTPVKKEAEEKPVEKEVKPEDSAESKRAAKEQSSASAEEAKPSPEDVKPAKKRAKRGQ